MKVKKEFLTVKILVHPFQAAIVRGLESGKIDLAKDTLREIAVKIGNSSEDSPQIIKHHLDALVKWGIIQKMYGEYVYLKINSVKRNKK